MVTSAAVRRKGIQAKAFLEAGEGGKRKKPSFTRLIVSNDRGHSKVRKLAEGVPIQKAERIRQRAKLGEDVFAGILGYSKVHYKRLQKGEKQSLRAVAANRLYRFAQVLEHAVELYEGDETAALKWLNNPNPAFEDHAPMELLKSEVGADMVDRLITQLELGILPV